MRDRTGDLLAHADTEDHKARIRQLLCLGADTCNFDHEHAMEPSEQQPCDDVSEDA